MFHGSLALGQQSYPYISVLSSCEILRLDKAEPESGQHRVRSGSSVRLTYICGF